MTENNHNFEKKAREFLEAGMNIVTENKAINKDGEVMIQTVKCKGCGDQTISLSFTTEEMEETINFVIDRKKFLETVNNLQLQENQPGRR